MPTDPVAYVRNGDYERSFTLGCQIDGSHRSTEELENDLWIGLRYVSDALNKPLSFEGPSEDDDASDFMNSALEWLNDVTDDGSHWTLRDNSIFFEANDNENE